MDKKDKIIADLRAKNEAQAKKIAELENKSKKKSKTKFALDNLDLFWPILETIKQQDRYVFNRKVGKKSEQVIKINAFINDLLVAKIKLGGNVPDSQIGSRLSMDEFLWLSLSHQVGQRKLVRVERKDAKDSN